VKSHRRANADTFCPVRSIHRVPCSELYWGFSEQTLKKPTVCLLCENMKETVASFIFPEKEELKIFFKQGADVNVIRMDFHKKQSPVSFIMPVALQSSLQVCLLLSG